MQISGFFWHIHHEVLLEWSNDIRERIAYIKDFKPVDQVEIRLRLMQPVKGELPTAVVEAHKVFDEAEKAYNEAQRAYYEAIKVHVEAGKAYAAAKVCNNKALEANNEAFKAYYEALKAYNEAAKAYNEAWDVHAEALIANAAAIEKLHRKECLDCPWDGKTIFP